VTVNNPQKSASVQVSRTELDWLVGMVLPHSEIRMLISFSLHVEADVDRVRERACGYGDG
jgi:hypothetical protein